jgi:hypothetical protein
VHRAGAGETWPSVNSSGEATAPSINDLDRGSAARTGGSGRLLRRVVSGTEDVLRVSLDRAGLGGWSLLRARVRHDKDIASLVDGTR